MQTMSDTHQALIGMFLQGLARVVPGQHGKPDGWHCYACDSTFGDQKHVLGHVTGPVHIKNCALGGLNVPLSGEDDGDTMEEADAVVEDEDCNLKRAEAGLPFLDFKGVPFGPSGGSIAGSIAGAGGGAGGGAKLYFQRAYKLLLSVRNHLGVNPARIDKALKALKAHVDLLKESIVIEDGITNEDAIDLAEMMLTFMEI
ncbi:C2H2-type domain-containing protein [Pycnococcus provasolii]